MSDLGKCPKCGREFAHKNQWHSCVSISPQSHFVGKPPWMKEAYGKILSAMKKNGPVRSDAAGSSVHFAAARHFAGLRVQKHGMKIGFILERVETDRRIQKRQKLWGRKVEHVVQIGSAKEINAKLLGWLNEAYAAGGKK